MITILVVGRNDYYGINLHKRTALSLNYFAAMCRDPNDEIIYVDCNTPPHELTLAEAIADTLTEQARSRLRIFRISGEQMHREIGETPMKFSDELSRNVGLRRSNPANEWVLSTNCDILLMPLSAASLGELVRDLPRRFYLCPRYNVPAATWQGLDRQDVREITELCQNELQRGVLPPPRHKEEWLRFSAVGDFQLAPREQWLAIGGCEEGMKLWGHSDANNALRLNLLNGGGRTPDLADKIALFHLDHNASKGSAHENVLPGNDWDQWITNVTSPASRNPEAWGMRDENLAEIRLPLSSHRRSHAGDLFLAPSGVARMRNQMAASFWVRAGRPLNRLKRMLGLPSD